MSAPKVRVWPVTCVLQKWSREQIQLVLGVEGDKLTWTPWSLASPRAPLVASGRAVAPADLERNGTHFFWLLPRR